MSSFDATGGLTSPNTDARRSISSELGESVNKLGAVKMR
jgi:hypothetical protein